MMKDMISPVSEGDFICADSLSKSYPKQLYFALLEPKPHDAVLAQSRRFLYQQLDSVESMASDLPPKVEGLMDWMRSNTALVGKQYRDYLAQRRSGQGQRYFPTKSHALHFLKGVAPTKLVDGAWLYGLVSQWRDSRYIEPIKIYLEELGDGEAEKNHVLIYKNLLAAHECTHWENLPESNFIQGAIQLSLAQHASEFLPEIIGFNLGYEQLPLHLLICAYELAEWDIDPYYFTLHVTIDNSDTGHAARAVQAVKDAMPNLGDRDSFYQRVQNGYQLNSLGAGTTQIIADFDLEQELLNIFATKAVAGSLLHSDYCRIGGKTVNEWLAEPEQIHEFVEILVEKRWIRRNEHPSKSRFWNLLVGEKGAMFGVFNAYELQVIYDWIAGESLQAPASMNRRYKNRRQGFDSTPQDTSESKAYSDEFSAELNLLTDKLARAPDKNAAMDLLVPWLSPIYHHTPIGLMATRIFAQKLKA